MVLEVQIVTLYLQRRKETMILVLAMIMYLKSVLFDISIGIRKLTLITHCKLSQEI